MIVRADKYDAWFHHVGPDKAFIGRRYRHDYLDQDLEVVNQLDHAWEL